MKKNITQLGKRLKELRDSTGLNQTEFAIKADIKRTASISDYENGKREPELATLCNIAKLGNVSLDWLLTGKGSPNKNNEPQPISPIPTKSLQDEPLELTLLKQKVEQIYYHGSFDAKIRIDAYINALDPGGGAALSKRTTPNLDNKKTSGTGT